MGICGPGPKIEEILDNQELPMTLADTAQDFVYVFGSAVVGGGILGEIVWKIAGYNLH